MPICLSLSLCWASRASLLGCSGRLAWLPGRLAWLPLLLCVARPPSALEGTAIFAFLSALDWVDLLDLLDGRDVWDRLDVCLTESHWVTWSCPSTCSEDLFWTLLLVLPEFCWSAHSHVVHYVKLCYRVPQPTTWHRQLTNGLNHFYSDAVLPVNIG